VRRRRKISRRKNQQGVIITLVAVFMLFVIGAMAALSIDEVTLYTARSEAQLAADAAALAGARVLANSGMTSASSSAVGDNAVSLALAVATQVAASSMVGGRNLNPGASPCVAGQEICVNIPETGVDFVANPQVIVQVQRADLPTFFARIWGTTKVKVAASATAEAYNPSSLQGTGGGPGVPVAPMCVKPWLLPNISPTTVGGPIFTAVTGAIADTTLIGWSSTATNNATLLSVRCPGGNCSTTPLPSPAAWKYFPGDTTLTFTPAPQAFPTCAPALATAYEQSVGGCIQTPIACNNPTAYIATTDNFNQDRETAEAVNCMTHATTGGGDTVTVAAVPPTEPFEFVAGADNPIPGASGNDVMVSDSLVTVPVFDSGTVTNPTPNPVQVIGFVQLFLNPTGAATRLFGPNRDRIPTTVINIVGCGDGLGAASGQPILGNGASPVAVRLVSPP
jgi:hypothetical protein